MKSPTRHIRIQRQFLALCLSGVICISNANAILMVSLSNYDSHKALSTNPTLRFTTSIEVTTASGSKVYSSGVAIAPNVILVAAHGIPSVTSSAVVTKVSMGANAYGEEAKSYAIQRWERYPSYVPRNWNTLDFGLVYLDEFIADFNPISFGSVSIGEIVTIVGYGNFAEMYASSSQQSLGDRLAGYAPVYNFGGQWPEELYLNTYLSLNSQTSSLNVMGIPGDSGGPYFNSIGQIVGIHTGSTNGFDGGFGTAMRTSTPDFIDYVTPRIAASWAAFYAQRQPKLVNVSIEVSAATQPPKFSGTVANGPPLGTARLQASLDLGTTDPWADVASVTLDAVGSATFTNIPDSRPQALGAPSDYFRVVTESSSSP